MAREAVTQRTVLHHYCSTKIRFEPPTQSVTYIYIYIYIIYIHIYILYIYIYIKTHGSESRGQGGSTLRRPLDERT